MVGPKIIQRPFYACQAIDNLNLDSLSRLDTQSKDRQSPSHEKPTFSKEAKNDISHFLFHFDLPLFSSFGRLQSGSSPKTEDTRSALSSSSSTRGKSTCLCPARFRSTSNCYSPRNLRSRWAYMEHSQTMEAWTAAQDAGCNLPHPRGQWIQGVERGVLHFLLWTATRWQHSRQPFAMERTIPTR